MLGDSYCASLVASPLLVSQPEPMCNACAAWQAGDLHGLLKSRGGELLMEEEVMLCFVQLVMGVAHIHEHVSPVGHDGAA